MGLINQLITGGHHPVLVDESIGVIIHELNWKSSQQSQDMMVSRVCGGTMMWGTLNKEESHAEKKSRAIAAPRYCWLFSSDSEPAMFCQVPKIWSSNDVLYDFIWLFFLRRIWR